MLSASNGLLNKYFSFSVLQSREISTLAYMINHKKIKLETLLGTFYLLLAETCI